MNAQRFSRTIGALALVVAPVLAVGGVASATSSHTLIQGSGSSWAANAVNQWVADVKAQGMEVVYNPSGDAAGRQDYANRTSDFAVTSLGYQGIDHVTGVSDTSQGRPYAYLPIAAGGTAFPYQIRVHGIQVRNLRLSGQTLAKIFTNQITNWDNKEITADNDGHALPSLPITPVVQSEGSGSTAQLTRYFGREFPSVWRSFNGGSSAMTEYFPRAGNQIAQNGSDGAMNYVSSKQANGSIGYVEYSYALSQNYPVVKMLNSAGYYTLPTQFNVAVALEKAQINMDKSSPNYLLQNLDNVYVDKDPRTYPLSSYVYEIEPTGTHSQDSKMTTAKRQTIADFTYYSICQGQKEIGPIGYSPLPVNLVEAGFGQLAKLKKADSKVNLSSRSVRTCDNPTFVKGHPSSNYLAKIAPLPPSCDKVGHTPCAANVTPTGTQQVHNPANGHSGGTNHLTIGANHSGGGATGGGHVATGGSRGGGGSTGGTAVAASGGGTQSADESVTEPASLAGYRSPHLTAVLAPLAVLLILAILILPPVIAYRMSGRQRGSG
ncbi:MAG TPA: substrate-binding domain-containing protein [Mycobacteriales bacterium]|nr:substrate-binding domain-containing protein [Mycobacteriales bacterium]